MTFVNYLKGYTVSLTSKADKQLSRLAPEYVKKINKKLEDLVAGKQNLDVKKMADFKIPTYRLRVGVYRVLYEVFEDKVVVSVFRIGPRKSVYEF